MTSAFQCFGRQGERVSISPVIPAKVGIQTNYSLVIPESPSPSFPRFLPRHSRAFPPSSRAFSPVIPAQAGIQVGRHSRVFFLVIPA